MSIDGIESEDPYEKTLEGSWFQFGVMFVLVLIFGILAVIGSCIFHKHMYKKGWTGILFGLLNKIFFAFVTQWYVQSL